ncbi:hypothetical protein D1BOALGB6SA_10596 [Olavius sp. associated proteobacterium Delta 1]|nr:hypothetical protein D1BOALGB6SA_10596 [Olavius sp. associated proteobacterium Delta 1]
MQLTKIISAWQVRRFQMQNIRRNRMLLLDWQSVLLLEHLQE